MNDERLRQRLGELVDATRGLIDALTDEQVEPASSPPAPWPAGAGLRDRLRGYPADSPVGSTIADILAAPVVSAKRHDVDAELVRLRYELDAAQRGHMRTTSVLDSTREQLESTEAARLSCSTSLAARNAKVVELTRTITELRDQINMVGKELVDARVALHEIRDQRDVAVRRIADLTERLAGASVIDSAEWRVYDVELDTNGEPPVIADGELVGRWRPMPDGPGGEVHVRFVPGSMTHPGTGSRYVVSLPITPPDGPPRFTPGVDPTD
jgi:hypothetical protein